MTTSPTGGAAQRDALRKAIRQHPDFSRVWTGTGREFQNVHVKELYRMAGKLGLDPRAITAAVRAGTYHHDPEKAPWVLVKGFKKMPEGFVPVTADDDDTMDPNNYLDDDVAREDTDTTSPTDMVAMAVEAEVRAIRDAVTQNGFSALDERLRELVTEARKPAVTVYVDRTAPAGDGASAPVIVSRPTDTVVTWRKAFSVRGAAGDRTMQVWDGAHPDTPDIDPVYVWQEAPTVIALTQIARGRNVYAFGPAGTGKTQWAEQLAARLRRPFALISCDAATDGPTLVGMTVPKGDTVAWQDGQLTRAIQIPGCVVCIDEPSIARPGALFAMQDVLANRRLWISETGRRVEVAHGVVFIATDNTNGMGGGARRGYTDTQRLNLAFLDRFGARPRFGYLPEDREARVIVARTGCTHELAKLLVSAATLTRAAAEQEQVTNGIGLRRLLAWAELLTDGVDVDEAFDACILNAAPDQDRETLRQQCALAVDAGTVARALGTMNATTSADPAVTNRSAAGRAAANEFRLSA